MAGDATTHSYRSHERQEEDPSSTETVNHSSRYLTAGFLYR
jgi:hypothetical protein